MPKLLKPYYDFRGGLNTDAAPDNLADNELERADNAVMAERGGLKKRNGTAAINETSYGEPVEQLFEWTRADGSVELLAIVGDDLCLVNESNGSLTVLHQVASRRIGRISYQDKLYFVDGIGYFVYDGSTVDPVTPASEQDNDLEPIERCRYLAYHPNSFRVFAAGDSQNTQAVYYSEPGDPTYFKNTNVLFPSTAEGPVKGLFVFGDALVVLYENGMWAWRGVEPGQDATWVRLPAPIGPINEATVALTPNSMTFLGPGGLYAVTPSILGFDVTILPDEGLVRNLAKDKVMTLIRSITNPDHAVAVYDGKHQRYMLAYRDDGISERSNYVLVYDWELGSFTRWTNLFITDFCYRRSQELWAATSDGYIIRMNEGYSDYHGSPIRFEIYSKQYNLDFPFHNKRIFRLYVASRQPPTDEETMITARLIVDGTEQYVVINQSIRPNFVWGDPWGGIWGWVDIVTSRLRVSASGHRVQLRIENDQSDLPVTIYGMAFEFRPKRAKGDRL